MHHLHQAIEEICRVLAFYSDRLPFLRAVETNSEPLTRGYLSGDSAEMAYRALQPWYRLVEPLYAELEMLMQESTKAESDWTLQQEVIKSLLPALYRIRAAYEFDKEMEEAEHFLQREDVSSALEEMIEHQSYWILTEPVLAALQGCKKIAIVGSGPLPLTALSIAARTDLEITCFERDEKAHKLGQDLINLTDHHKQITCLNEIAEPNETLNAFDAIFTAVLLGVSVDSTDHLEKKQTLSGFLDHLPDGGKVILRDPFELGELFYPPANMTGNNRIKADRYDPETGPGMPYRSSFLILETRSS